MVYTGIQISLWTVLVCVYIYIYAHANKHKGKIET